MGGQGYSNLIDKEGRYVVRSSLPVGTAKDALSVDMLGQFEDEELAQLKTALSQGGGGVYSYKDAQNGGKQLIAIEPVGVNDWFVMSVVPLAVLPAALQRHGRRHNAPHCRRLPDFPGLSLPAEPPVPAQPENPDAFGL